MQDLWNFKRLGALTLVLLWACRPGATIKNSTFTPPDHVDVDGEHWQQTEATQQDFTLLENYFRAHQDLMHHPALDGSLVLYRSTGGRLRFYWVYAIGKEPLWMYLQFDNFGRFERWSEGTGEPFVQPVKNNRASG